MCRASSHASRRRPTIISRWRIRCATSCCAAGSARRLHIPRVALARSRISRPSTSWGLISATTSSISTSTTRSKPPSRSSAWISIRCSPRSPSPASATAASADSRPASSTPSRRSRSRHWAMASATSSESSSRRSWTAGRWRRPTSGSRWAIRGRSHDRSGLSK